MTVAEQAQRDAINIAADVPVVFQWNGADYEGTRGALVREAPMLQGGILDQPTLIISAGMKKINPVTLELEDRFPGGTLPLIRDLFLVDDAVYAIERVTTDEFESMVQFDLRGPHV